MNPEQMQILAEYVFSDSVSVDAPYVPGKPWAIGMTVSDAERQAFRDKWAQFKELYPEIAAQLPVRAPARTKEEMTELVGAIRQRSMKHAWAALHDALENAKRYLPDQEVAALQASIQTASKIIGAHITQ